MKDLEKIVFEKLKDHPRRINHTKGVIEVAVTLGKIHGVDLDLCYIAALFHDFTKHESLEFHQKYLGKDFIDKHRKLTFMYHAHSAAMVLKEIMPNIDNQVLDAIRYHIWCRPNATRLEKIIYLADKCEPNRIYPEARETYNLALKDLDEALIYSLKANIKHLESKNIVAHPEQIKTLVYYQVKKEKI
ncbi:MAG: bis(5'-nucleosyl)-tetraphosphatase (symmetrical) YqeK [Acholeplasmataceae bacterium]|jgi:predicted HD superfamily hydrolase involved in NAD metabolism